jgi:hypothetical protein
MLLLPTIRCLRVRAAADDAGGGAGAAAAAGRRRDATASAASTAAPRWYVTQAELNSLASYMRGRLTLDKVRMTQLLCCKPASAIKTSTSQARLRTGDLASHFR